MSRRKRLPSDIPFLAQILFQAVVADAPCQGIIHQQREQPGRVNWEMRVYQDYELTLRLQQGGMPREQIDQVIWDAAINEQDTVGLVCHQMLRLCTDCVYQIASSHAGKAAATLSISTASLVQGAFLLVSDRLTERAAIISNIPQGTSDEEVFERMKQEEMLDLRYKPES